MRKFFVAVLLLVAVGFAKAGDITPTGMFQGDLYTFLSNVVTMSNEAKSDSGLLVESVRNAPHGYSAMAKGGTASATFTTTAAIAYSIDDVMYTLAASSPLGIATAPAAQVATTSCIYLCSVDSSGNYTWTKGTNVIYGSTPVAPAVPANTCPIAEILVDMATTSSDSFTLGTTAFNATGQTVTVTNIRWPRTGSSAIASPTTTDLTLTGL